MKTFEDILDSLDLETDSSSTIPPPNNKNKVSCCVFCSGKIVEDKYDCTIIPEFFCSNCGLKYKFLPDIK